MKRFRDSGKSVSSIAEWLGRDVATVTGKLHDLDSLSSEAQTILLMGAPKLAERIVNEADVSQAMEVLRDPLIAVMAPKTERGGGANIQVNVLPQSCGAIAEKQTVSLPERTIDARGIPENQG